MTNRHGALGLATPLLLVLSAFGGAAHAVTVPYPYIDVISLGSATDVTFDGTTLSMTATASTIVESGSSSTPISPEGTFTLTATYNSALSALESPTSNTYDFTGSLSINNGSNLLSANIADLQITSFSSGTLELAIGSAALSYTGGSLTGLLSSGTLLGSFIVNSGYTTNANGVANLSDPFSGYDLTAKVGAVVPLPASLPLLLGGLGLLGLGVRARAGRTA